MSHSAFHFRLGRAAAVLGLLAGWPGAAVAQISPTAGGAFRGGVPTGTATPTPIALSVGQAIRLALEHNLGVLQAEDEVGRATGSRWLTLSALLPDISAGITESRRKTNLEAFGFPLGPNFPRVVGPFNVFDARVFVRQSLFDLEAVNHARAGAHTLAAARHDYRSARDLVVLVSANLYLQTLAAEARAATARAQRESAEALLQQAQDLRAAGLVAGLDVVRAEVRSSADHQRATAAQNVFEKSKLQLARVVGLPLGQTFTLSDQLPPVPVPDLTLEAALEQAYRGRADFKAAQERLRAAEATRQAAFAGRLPSVDLNADYGTIGLSAGSALPTFTVIGNVHVPIFDAGRSKGLALQADADVRGRRAEVENLRAEIDYDVRSAFLDLTATGEELQTATRARELAALQLTQSRDRFAAGVTNNIEVIQAQEAVTQASEQYIAAIYGYNVAKALLARSLGTAEEAVEKYLGGKE
jgi:outer membrane protein TolC